MSAGFGSILAGNREAWKTDYQTTVPVPCRRSVRETAKAELVQLVDGSERWVPKAVIRGRTSLEEGGFELLVDARFAEREHLDG